MRRLLWVWTIFVAGCTKDPETGRSQLRLISEEHERELGVQSYQKALSGARISNDPRETAPLARVGERIARAAARPDFQWEYHVIVDPRIQNAWCLPGGKIAFYSGLFPVLLDEAGMAFVMGHEVSHALLHHSAERMSEQMVAEGVKALVKASVDQVDPRHEPLIMRAFGMATQMGVLLPYSRKHESEADRLGLTLMAKAGYDPRQAIEVWKRMSSLNAGQPPEWLSTHPSHERRIADLEAELPEALRLYEQSSHAAVAKLVLVGDRSALRNPDAPLTVSAQAGTARRGNPEEGKKTLTLEFSFDRDVHLERLEITGPGGVRDTVTCSSGVPALAKKHVTLVRRDPARPDFESGEYTTIFQGSSGGVRFRARCVHTVP
jgi:hypothetical protein